MYYGKISPQAERLLREIIETKNSNINECEYWMGRFSGLSIDADLILRGLFKELKDSDLIQTIWGSGVPTFIQLTSSGFYYFENQEEVSNEVKSSMFEELDKKSEALLCELLEKGKVPCNCARKEAKILLEKRYVRGDIVMESPNRNEYFIADIEYKGEVYFEMKMNYQKRVEKSSSISIVASDNAAINLNTGSGSAIQTVSYLGVEQLGDLHAFVSKAKESCDLTPEQKIDIEELVNEIMENHKKGKKLVVKSLIPSVTQIVAATKVLNTLWDNIRTLFE